jgi:hypothetical protein
MTAVIASAHCQPKFEISAWLKGSIANWPKEPPAATNPSAAERVRSSKARRTTPIATPKLVPERPKPTRRPAVKANSAPLGLDKAMPPT